MNLNSIKAQYQEESARINALEDEEEALLMLIERLQSAGSRTPTAAKRNNSSSRSARQVADRNVVAKHTMLEKQWISTPRPLNKRTHNMKLLKTQTDSAARLKVCESLLL